MEFYREIARNAEAIDAILAQSNEALQMCVGLNKNVTLDEPEDANEKAIATL